MRRRGEDSVRPLKARTLGRGYSAEAKHRALLEVALRPNVTGRELWEKLARGEKSDLDLDRNARDEIESADIG